MSDRREIKEVHREVLQAFDKLFAQFPHTCEVKDYGHKWTFPNGMRFDLLCHQEKKPVIFRISRGRWLVKQNPLLGMLFTPLGVIGKMEIQDSTLIEEKHIVDLLQYVFTARPGVKAFD